MEVVAFGLDDVHTRRQYDALFADCPRAFIQQSTLWAEAIRGLGPDEPIFLMALEGKAIGGLPLYLYRGPAGSVLTSVPQPGPLGGVFVRDGHEPGPIYAALLREANRIAVDRQCIALTLITNPCADDLALYEHHLSPDLVFENFTQIVPIDGAVRHGEWVLPDNSERNPGRTIRKAKAAGLQAGLVEDHETFDRWYAVHRRRHGELRLTPLPYELLAAIYAVLGAQGKAFLQLVRSGDEVVAGCLFIHHRDVCDAYIMSMDSAHAAKAPNYLLVEQALFTMWRRGVRFMNWQSSPRRGDGVYNFKKQWGSEERSYYFVTKTYCKPETLSALGAEGVRRGYPGHYVVPFAAFDAGFTQKRYRKP
jgi:hypothetical protein